MGIIIKLIHHNPGNLLILKISVQTIIHLLNIIHYSKILRRRSRAPSAALPQNSELRQLRRHC
ncbi:MAG: hypothetical protein BWK80_36730 [Desulfobacteraceae bacterium IS3]|nr:MAG: hypothetical protein BWK80_36730 [Desulfobacteraceae bacterium IS3]